MPSDADLKSLARRLFAQGYKTAPQLSSGIALAAGVPVTVAATIAAGVIAEAKTAAVGLDVTGDLAGVVRQAVDLPTRILAWVTDTGTLMRIAYVLGGLALIGIAMGQILAPEVAKVAGAVAKVAK